MKFRDGYWGLKENVKLLNPVEIRDLEASSSSLTLYATCKKTNHRGDTLNAPMITTVFSSPMDDVIHVRSFHFKGVLDRGPRFNLASDRVSVPLPEGSSSASFYAGSLKIRTNGLGPWGVDVYFKEKLLTSLVGKHSGYVVLDRDGKKDRYMSQHLSLSVGETVYGLGERFTPFVKNGQVVDIWNEDGGTSSEQAYKNIPFYITSQGYGVLVANPGKVSFEVASEVVTSVQFSVPGEVLDYYIIGGDTLKDVLRNYALLAGKPALPPAWSFGLWLTTSFTTSYDEKTVNSFIDGMAQRDIPLSVFHFDCFWMKEFQWVDFQWDAEQFPEPEAMLKRLKARGLRICVWINPYIAQKSRLFDEAMEKGYLVKNADGNVWQWDRWQAGMGLVDFTNAGAVSWFQAQLKKLLDMGVDTFKTDFGERIPTQVVYHDGSDPEKLHNYYTYLYNKSVFDVLEREKGKNNALVFARSATVGSQQFPVHWGGDCSATYESMAETLRGGLSIALSGFAFWSHDIGGFEGTATADLFKRWVAFGLLSSHSRLHGNESYRVPWHFDDEASDVLRFFVKQKNRLMPYLFGHANVATQEGLPLMRPMVLEFPDDPACAFLDRQYMLGDSLLVAPIFSDSGEVSYYLPPGVWTNFISGERIVGGSWRKERHDYFSLPLMVRPHSVIPLGLEDAKPDYDYTEHPVFHVFELEDGQELTSTVYYEGEAYNEGGEKRVVFTIRRNGSHISVQTEGTTGEWGFLLRGVSSVESVKAGTAIRKPEGTLITVFGTSAMVKL